MKPHPWTTLEDLRNGAIFETHGGVRAVKTEYHYPWGGIECVLLESGEYAHFNEENVDVQTRRAQHNGTEVREVSFEVERAEAVEAERKETIEWMWVKAAEIVQRGVLSLDRNRERDCDCTASALRGTANMIAQKESPWGEPVEVVPMVAPADAPCVCDQWYRGERRRPTPEWLLLERYEGMLCGVDLSHKRYGPPNEQGYMRLPRLLARKAPRWIPSREERCMQCGLPIDEPHIECGDDLLATSGSNRGPYKKEK